MRAAMTNPQSNKFMVLFFQPVRNGPFLDRFLSFCVSLYSKCFGHTAPTTHCALVLDNWCYEVSLAGCSKYEFEESLFFHPCVKAVFVIEGVCETTEQQERLEAAKFMLEQDFAINRKLDVKACLSYLFWFWVVSFQQQLKLKFSPYNICLDFSLKPGTMKIDKEANEIRFHLPFTCASQVAFVLTKLFNLDPILDSHLPSSLFFSLFCIARLGYGTMIVR